MEDIIPKLKSDRLWAFIAYLCIVLANAKMGLGLDEVTMANITKITGAFILGKSLRGSTTGSILSALIPGVPGKLMELVVDKKSGKKKGKKGVKVAATVKELVDAVPDEQKKELLEAAGSAVKKLLKKKPPKQDPDASPR